MFALLSLYLVAHTLPRAWRSLNTDFPNYYLTARLTREGVDPARAYEWIWLQREKDHRNIDQRIVGLVPITPFFNPRDVADRFFCHLLRQSMSGSSSTSLFFYQ